MGKKSRRGRERRPERRITVRSVRRDKPDAKKISEVLVALALAQAEKDAETEHQRRHERRTS